MVIWFSKKYCSGQNVSKFFFENGYEQEQESSKKFGFVLKGQIRPIFLFDSHIRDFVF